MKEYQSHLAANGLIDVDEDSAERKGWTKIPYGIPDGLVVTHASLNIGMWLIKLAAKTNM
jgi:hypothetical protein